MERSSEKRPPYVSIGTSKDVVVRTMGTLTSTIKKRGVNGFFVAA